VDSKASIIDGKQEALKIQRGLKASVDRLMTRHGIRPGLVIIRVGDDPASKLYVSSKGKQASAVGCHFQEHYFSDDVTQTELVECIDQLNQDASVHGIIVQLPLPERLDKFSLLCAIDPAKDVDGLHPLNVGKLWQDDSSGLIACTPQGCQILLNTVHPSLVGKDVLVIGSSLLVGRPMAALLLNAGATVTLAHNQTKDLPDLCRKAEIMIVAIGDPQFIQADWIRPGATVLDVGINRLEDGRVVGDVDFENAIHVAGAMTPVPGGVGPMTVVCLLRNTLLAAERTMGLS